MGRNPENETATRAKAKQNSQKLKPATSQRV
jgi:hypothetical protein